ncbi:MAG: hypothetical protein ACI4R9_09530 [Kiritimatiellia bacterium]
MNKVRPKPRKALRHEFYSLVAVMAVPLALIVSFPYAAIGFIPAAPTETPRAACAFVTLRPDEETDILAAARAAWKVSADRVRRMRADLSLAEIPDDTASALADIADRRRPPPAGPIRFDVLPLPPSCAAPPPAKIPADSADAEGVPTFPRSELLTIDID